MSDASCLALDRVSPCRRPEGRAAGHQTWENLLFVPYTFPAEVVRPLLPAALDPDLWRGEAWVGIVPSEMEHIPPASVPPPGRPVAGLWTGAEMREASALGTA